MAGKYKIRESTMDTENQNLYLFTAENAEVAGKKMKIMFKIK